MLAAGVVLEVEALGATIGLVAGRVVVCFVEGFGVFLWLRIAKEITLVRAATAMARSGFFIEEVEWCHLLLRIFGDNVSRFFVFSGAAATVSDKLCLELVCGPGFLSVCVGCAGGFHLICRYWAGVGGVGFADVAQDVGYLCVC